MYYHYLWCGCRTQQNARIVDKSSSDEGSLDDEKDTRGTLFLDFWMDVDTARGAGTRQASPVCLCRLETSFTMPQFLTFSVLVRFDIFKSANDGQ
jgi:hypothetical protein